MVLPPLVITNAGVISLLLLLAGTSTKKISCKTLPVFNVLKLRAAYGVSGNSTGFNAYTTKTIYANGTSYFYYMGNWINAIVATQNANANLKWERTAAPLIPGSILHC